MKTPRQLLRPAIALLLAAGMAATLPARASVTYTYTAPITSWYDATGHNWWLYAGINSALKFEFTVAAPLISVDCGGPNLCLTDITAQLLSWHYHGGSDFMNLGTGIGGTLTGISVKTDAAGNILGDRFYLNGATVIAGLEAYTSSFSEAHDGYDQQGLFSNYPRQYTTGSHGEPLYLGLNEGMSNTAGAGSWVMAAAADTPGDTPSDPPSPGNDIPEPGGLALMTVALAGFGASRSRAKPGP